MLRADIKQEPSLHLNHLKSPLAAVAAVATSSSSSSSSTTLAAFGRLSAVNNGSSSSAMDANSSMDSNVTLWQFLLSLLTTGEHRDLIQWTNNAGEFKLLDSEAVAKLWGIRKGKNQMNYDKLSRALRYYYDKNIIRKVSDWMLGCCS